MIMKRFEYKICRYAEYIRCGYDFTSGVKGVNTDELNKYGEEGWEAVGVLDDERVLMKREIQ